MEYEVVVYEPRIGKCVKVPGMYNVKKGRDHEMQPCQEPIIIRDQEDVTKIYPRKI